MGKSDSFTVELKRKNEAELNAKIVRCCTGVKDGRFVEAEAYNDCPVRKLCDKWWGDLEDGDFIGNEFEKAKKHFQVYWDVSHKVRDKKGEL